jgi:hypothetical protein
MSETQAVIGLWCLSGLGFWVSCIRHSPPVGWFPRGRETGWGEAITLYLPAFLIGGPLWWAVFAYCRLQR